MVNRLKVLMKKVESIHDQMGNFNRQTETIKKESNKKC